MTKERWEPLASGSLTTTVEKFSDFLKIVTDKSREGDKLHFQFVVSKDKYASAIRNLRMKRVEKRT